MSFRHHAELRKVQIELGVARGLDGAVGALVHHHKGYPQEQPAINPSMPFMERLGL